MLFLKKESKTFSRILVIFSGNAWWLLNTICSHHSLRLQDCPWGSAGLAEIKTQGRIVDEIDFVVLLESCMRLYKSLKISFRRC